MLQTLALFDSCLAPEKMETLEEDSQSPSTTDNRLAKMNANASFPNEIMEEILSRLPVKSIFQFRSVSKPWPSRISNPNPSFTNLQLTHATQSLFISSFDQSATKRYLLSAPRHGGPVTHLFTLHNAGFSDITDLQHVNGLVLFTCMEESFKTHHHFVFNPATRNIFPLPDPPCVTNRTYDHVCFSFGFDQSTNQHKVLNIRKVYTPYEVEIMIYSMSSHTWAKVDVAPPVGVSWDRLCYNVSGTVCVNGVIHFMIPESFNVLAFDLKTDKFSVISTPRGVVPDRPSCIMYIRNGKYSEYLNVPRIMEINGCIGVVCHGRVNQSGEVDIWLLQDYENGVWVREVITHSKPWRELDGAFLSDAVDMDEVIFSSSKVSENVITLPVYNRKSGSFSSLRFTLADKFLCSKTMEFNQIKCYVESIMPI